MRSYAFGFFTFSGCYCTTYVPGKVNRMARPDKTAAVAELTEDFRTATATVLTEYRVIQDLRVP